MNVLRQCFLGTKFRSPAQEEETADYEQEIDYYKKSYHDIYNLDFLLRNMFVVPIHFAKEHKLMGMLTHTKRILEYNGGSIAINARFDKLITSLKTTVENSL
jgi:hypothetical protein